MIHVAYTIDIQGGGAAQFADQLFVSALSVKETRAKGDEVTVHVLYGKIDADTAIRLSRLDGDGFSVDMRRIPSAMMASLQQMSKHSPTSKIRTWSGIVYARIFLAQLLPDVDRAIYLDADTMARQPVSQLWDEELNGKMLGMNMGLVPEYGFNSGVILMDLAKMRKEADWNALVGFMRREAHTFYCPDQTVLNRFFAEEITPLPRKYNYAPIQGALDRNGMCGAVIWHWYNGHSKPFVLAREDVGISHQEWNRLYMRGLTHRPSQCHDTHRDNTN